MSRASMSPASMSPASMSPAMTFPAVWIRRSADFNVLLLICWLLGLACFSIPGRGGPLEMSAVDPIALAKIFIRGGSVMVLAAIILRQQDHLRSGAALVRMTPLLLFAFWCVASTLWSPLKAVTVGHAVEVLAGALLATVIAIFCASEDCRERLFFHLFLSSMVLSLAILVLEWRVILARERPAGYVHPNTLGAVSGVALVILLAARLQWNWRWARSWLPCGLIVCGVAHYAARSRAALVATVIALALLFLARRQLVSLTILCALLGTGVALYPYVGAVEHVPDSISAYVMRGQDREALAAGSGRDELWAIALKSIPDALWFGHGYFVITRSGSMFVWGKQQFQTAHNVYLHLLGGTGICGTLLFVWGVGSGMRPSFTNWLGKTEFLGLLVLIWFLVLGCFEISMLGSLDPAVVAFYACIGAVAASAGVAA